MPVSATVTTASRVAAEAALTEIWPPGGVYWMALSRRFCSTSRSRRHRHARREDAEAR